MRSSIFHPKNVFDGICFRKPIRLQSFLNPKYHILEKNNIMTNG